MKSEQLLEAINDARDEYVEEMMGVMLSPAKSRRVRPVLRTVLLAAALSLLLGATAYAAFRGTMAHREPSPTDEPGYFIHWSDVSGDSSDDTQYLNWGDAAMILRLDAAEEGFRHLYRLGELPEGVRAAGQSAVPHRIVEEPDRDPQLPPKTEVDTEKLAEMGLTEEEAEKWMLYKTECSRDGEFSLVIDLADVDALTNHDLILGWLGGEASVVKEDSFGTCQRLEVEVTACQKDPQALRCLFLFEPEEQYLLALVADPARFSMEELEAIAAGIEVRATGLKVYADAYSSSNFSVLGLAKG